MADAGILPFTVITSGEVSLLGNNSNAVALRKFLLDKYGIAISKNLFFVQAPTGFHPISIRNKKRRTGADIQQGKVALAFL